MGDDELRGAIAHVRALADDLDEAAVDRLAVDARIRVHQWRWADHNSGPHRIEPWWAIRRNFEGGWRETGLDDANRDLLRVGLDQSGRPVLVERHSYGRMWIKEVWEYADGWVVVQERARWGPHAGLLMGELPHIHTVVWAHERGREFGAERWRWRGGVALRGEFGEVALTGWPLASANEFDVDAAGELLRMRTGVTSGEFREDNRLAEEQLVDALLGALAEARDLACSERGPVEPEPPAGEEIVVPSVTDVGVDLAAARQDRGVLERWLRDAGVGERAKGVAQDALAGFRLVSVQQDADDVGSRVGGPGLLPRGEEWPRTAAGRPLSFLAGIDLAELPREPPGTDVLPDAGWLLFFADLDDDGEALGFIGESTPNEPGEDARMLWVSPDAEPEAAEPPPDLPTEPHVRLRERRVAARAQLTLRDGYESAQLLGLGGPESSAYDAVADALRIGDGDEGESIGDDWVLGAVTGVQGHEPDHDTTLLLHLGSIEFLDAGAIQFRIPTAALTGRDWSRTVTEGDSA